MKSMKNFDVGQNGKDRLNVNVEWKLNYNRNNATLTLRDLLIKYGAILVASKRLKKVIMQINGWDQIFRDSKYSQKQHK